MRAIGYIIINQNDINEAERLNLKKPEPVMEEKELLFPVNIILLAYVHDDKIRTITTLKELHFKYEESVWNRIKAHLEHL